MKKLFCLLLGFSCSVFALDDNPIAPPSADVVDKFGVNLQTGQLSRKLNTISIGGELGLSHYVDLYTDFLSAGNNGFVDAFNGKVSSQKISVNVVQILTNTNGDITAIRDTGTVQSTFIPVRVMRAYGPAGTQDFLVYQNNVLNNDTSATTGYVYRPVGDSRNSLIESPDKRYLTWITPNGTESKYDRGVIFSGSWTAGSGGLLREVTYPNGFKIRVNSTDVTTNTGFMLKYQLRTPARLNTFDQMVAINLAYQYCAASADTCSTTGWPSVTFTWPDGTPSVFRQPGLSSSNYLVKMTTAAGVTDIQYQPENVCIKDSGVEDADCAANPIGGTKWYPRLHSIRTPESSSPNYQYTYKNQGTYNGDSVTYRETDSNGMDMDSGFSSGYTYWTLNSILGQIKSATLNGADSQNYSGPSLNSNNANVTWGNADTWVVTSQYDLNVIESVSDKKSGDYYYFKDSRHLVDKYYPVAGAGLAQQYIYNGPRGNLSQINAIAPSTPMVLKQADYASTCISPKTCNKPLSVTDANGNQTIYTYHQASGQVETVTSPADKHNQRPQVRYVYQQKFANYYTSSGVKVPSTDGIWMKTEERRCTKNSFSGSGDGASNFTGSCGTGDQEVVTRYEYNSDNLFLTGMTVTADGKTLRTCYKYDVYGNQISKTLPRAGLTSCN